MSLNIVVPQEYLQRTEDEVQEAGHDIHLDKNPLNYNKKNPNTDGAEFKQLSVVYNVLNDKKALSNNKMVRKILKKKNLYY